MSILLFTNNCRLYTAIKLVQDQINFQKDLDKLQKENDKCQSIDLQNYLKDFTIK